MSSRALHALRLFLVPGLPVAAAAVFVGESAGVADGARFIATVILFASIGAGLVLSWRFNQSRTAFALLLILGADRFWTYAFGPAGNFWLHATAIAAVSTLPALNLLAIAASRERGVLTSYGFARLGILLAEAALVGGLLWQAPRAVYRYVAFDPVPTRFFEWTRMPQPALALFFAAMIVFLVLFLRRRRAEDAGFFWGMLTLTIPVLLPPAARVFTVYAAGAALTLLAYVLEASHAMAFRDTLTGLPGRRAFENELLKLGRTYSIAVADIDYFKTFNDTYGHDVGDQVLRMVAGHLARVRGGGRAFRYGGEEFTILFPRRSPDDVRDVVEDLRRQIDEARFTLRRRNRPEKPPQEKGHTPQRRLTRLSVTVSVGIAGRNGNRRSADEVIQAADNALYAAKRDGRNRVSVAD
jgi:diguanylate cyclase (GGDEF)-like protein